MFPHIMPRVMCPSEFQVSLDSFPHTMYLVGRHHESVSTFNEQGAGTIRSVIPII